MKESEEERNKEIKKMKNNERRKERTLRMASFSLWSQNIGWLNTIHKWCNKGNARLRFSQKSGTNE
jgi:hypothetical protein